MEKTSTEQQVKAQAAEPAKGETQAIPAKVLLIDLDNCPNQIEKLSLHIEQFTRVIVSHGGTEPKVPFTLLSPLATPIHEKRLEFITAGKGENAADFALTFHAGLLVNQLPTNTEFTILSDDTDLDHAVHLLHGKGRKASRLSGKDQPVKAEPKPRAKSTTPKAKAQAKESSASGMSPINDAVKKFSAKLKKTKSEKRPKTKKALLNQIESHFPKNKKLAKSGEAIFNELEKQGTIKVDGDEVIYS